MLCMKRPSGNTTWKWRRINVDATRWRRIDVDTMSFWHQMLAGPGGLTLHNLIRVYFLLDTLKGEKVRLISLYKCAGKFEFWQYAHWLSFSMSEPHPYPFQQTSPPLEYHLNHSPTPLGTLTWWRRGWRWDGLAAVDWLRVVVIRFRGARFSPLTGVAGLQKYLQYV